MSAGRACEGDDVIDEPTRCALPGCSRPVGRAGQGRRRFCGAAHRTAARRQRLATRLELLTTPVPNRPGPWDPTAAWVIDPTSSLLPPVCTRREPPYGRPETPPDGEPRTGRRAVAGMAIAGLLAGVGGYLWSAGGMPVTGSAPGSGPGTAGPERSASRAAVALASNDDQMLRPRASEAAPATGRAIAEARVVDGAPRPGPLPAYPPSTGPVVGGSSPMVADRTAPVVSGSVGGRSVGQAVTIGQSVGPSVAVGAQPVGPSVAVGAQPVGPSVAVGAQPVGPSFAVGAQAVGPSVAVGAQSASPSVTVGAPSVGPVDSAVIARRPLDRTLAAPAIAGIPVTAPLSVPPAGSGASIPPIAPAVPQPGPTTGVAPAIGGAPVRSPGEDVAAAGSPSFPGVTTLAGPQAVLPQPTERTEPRAGFPVGTRPASPVTVGQRNPLAVPGLGSAAPQQRVPLDRTPASTERPNGVPVPAPVPVDPVQPAPPVPAEAASPVPTRPAPPARSDPAEAFFPTAVTDRGDGPLAGTRPTGKAERMRARALDREAVSPPAPAAALADDEPSDRGRPMGKAERSRVRAAGQADHEAGGTQLAVDAEHLDRKRDKDTATGRDNRDDDKDHDDKDHRENTGRENANDKNDTVRDDTGKQDTAKQDTGEQDTGKNRSEDGDDRSDSHAADRTRDAADDTRVDVQSPTDDRLTQPDRGESADQDRRTDRSAPSDPSVTATGPASNHVSDQPTSRETEADTADRDTRLDAGGTRSRRPDAPGHPSGGGLTGR